MSDDPNAQERRAQEAASHEQWESADESDHKHVWVNVRINNAEGGVKVCDRCGATGKRTPWF